jgi:[ribosomal protein S5]-alanine N-acetyltransferase
MGAWGIEHQGDQRLIGIANFSPPHHRRVELGYTIARTYWGEGYATEACQALVDFGFEQMHLARVEAVCLPDHMASARMLQKIGMQYEGLLRNYPVWRGKPCDLLMYAVTRS